MTMNAQEIPNHELLSKENELRDMTELRITDEVHLSESQMQNWPDSVITGLAIIGAALGDAQKQALLYEYLPGHESVKEKALYNELVRIAALCARAAIDMERRRLLRQYGSDEY